jgi:spermidine synthase
VGYLFAVGFVSILAQTVLLRELSVAFYGVELIYTLALGIWLFCSACGAMLCRHTKSPSSASIQSLFLLSSISIPVDVAFIRSIRLLFSDVPGGYLPLHTQIGVVCVSLLPAGLLLGLLFQWTARAYISGTKSLAAAYGIESLGGLAGGICATLFLKFGCQNFFIALLCAGAAAGSSLLSFRRSSSHWLRLTAIVAIGILTVLAWKSSLLDRLMTSWTHRNLVETRDTPYSRITVLSRDGQTSVFENDALLFDSEDTRAEEFVHPAAVQHPNPKKVLVLGGIIQGTVREVLLHSPESVDYVEQNPALIRIVAKHLPLDIQNSLRAANVRIIYDDPRRFLNRASDYDLILVGMPEPTSGQTNRFYTREFFRQCYAKLNAQGIVAFSLQSSENYWTPQLTRRMVSIYRAARSVFPEVVFIPGSTNVVIGSMDPLPKDPSIQIARLETRGIRARIISAKFLRYIYTNDRFREISRMLESGTAPVNTDTRPICYQYTILIWLSKFIPSSILRDFSFPELSGGRKAFILVVLSLLFLPLMRSPWPIKRTVLTGMAGFAGMVLETILLLHYQTKHGVLFQDIGILLTGFMAGLALGAFAFARMRHRISKGFGIALLVGFAGLSAVIGLEINSGGEAGLPEILGLLVLTGFFVSGVFAFAGLHAASDQGKVITPLYAADLIGGCIGSILASLVLAPLAGLAGTAYWLIPAALFSVLLL